MTKYRIVSRNKRINGDYSHYPYYYAQVKFLDLIWIDCHWFGESCDCWDTDINVVDRYVKFKLEHKGSSKEEVVKTYYDET